MCSSITILLLDTVHDPAGQVLTELVKAAMQNHIFSFNSEIRRQASGGAIGNTLTGSLAMVWMLYWARIFKTKLKSASEELKDFKLYFLKY